jgi:L-fuculose-phosphate aldolase
MSNDHQALQESVITTCCALTSSGLTNGTSGNASVRCDVDSFYVSPTGMPYQSLDWLDIPRVEISGRWYGRCRPSSEWRFHRDIYVARADVHAIVHTHSVHATALACNARDIPAFHYMVAVAGGTDIRCAPYATFGTQALSDNAVKALKDRKACLLANHGVIATGANLPAALALASEVENLAAQYIASLQVGVPHILDNAEMARVIDKFRTYGRQESQDDDLIHIG